MCAGPRACGGRRLTGPAPPPPGGRARLAAPWHAWLARLLRAHGQRGGSQGERATGRGPQGRTMVVPTAHGRAAARGPPRAGRGGRGRRQDWCRALDTAGARTPTNESAAAVLQARGPVRPASRCPAADHATHTFRGGWIPGVGHASARGVPGQTGLADCGDAALLAGCRHPRHARLGSEGGPGCGDPVRTRWGRVSPANDAQCSPGCARHAAATLGPPGVVVDGPD